MKKETLAQVSSCEFCEISKDTFFTEHLCVAVLNVRSSRPEVFCNKRVLRNVTNFTGKHLCKSLFFNKVSGLTCNFIKKETQAQVFSCESCEISKNTFFHRTHLVAASGMLHELLYTYNKDNLLITFDSQKC